MITRITLENFMSHAHTVIEPAAGLTVILGPNNCGKSAIVSALQTVCGDHSGDFMVRHGEKECAVTIETDDGHVICWRRGKKAGYVLDGVEVDRVGRGNLPDDLQTLLRLGKVRHPSKEEVEFDVHFGEQKSPIFLIDRQADTAAFFSTASDAEKLLEMQKLHKGKVADRRRQFVETKTDLEKLSAQLAALTPLDELTATLELAAREERELSRLDQDIIALEELIEQTMRQEQLVELHQHMAAALAPIQPPPQLLDCDPLESLAGELSRTAENVAYQRGVATTLATLKNAPEQVDVEPLNQCVDRLSICSATAEQSAARVNALKLLKEPPTPTQTKPLEELAARLQSASRHADASSARQKALANLGEPPPQDDPSQLTEVLARLALANSARIRQQHLLDDHSKQFQAIEADIAAWLWAHPNCPTCGQPTSREHFLAAHAGETHA